MDARKILGDSRKLKYDATAGQTAQMGSGMAFPVADLIQTFKPEVWEDFTEEWAYSPKKKCAEIIHYAGAGALLDVRQFR